MRPAFPRTEQAARPVPAWTADPELIGTSLSGLRKTIGPALITKAREMGVTLPSELDEPHAELTPELIMRSLRDMPPFLPTPLRGRLLAASDEV